MLVNPNKGTEIDCSSFICITSSPLSTSFQISFSSQSLSLLYSAVILTNSINGSQADTQMKDLNETHYRMRQFFHCQDYKDNSRGEKEASSSAKIPKKIITILSH